LAVPRAEHGPRISEREDILPNFAGCGDSQRAWLLLEDYFEKLEGFSFWEHSIAARIRESSRRVFSRAPLKVRARYRLLQPEPKRGLTCRAFRKGSSCRCW